MRVHPVSAVGSRRTGSITRIGVRPFSHSFAAIQGADTVGGLFIPIDRYISFAGHQGHQPAYRRHDHAWDTAGSDANTTESKEEQSMDVQFSGAIDFNPLLQQMSRSTATAMRKTDRNPYAHSLKTQQGLMQQINKSNRFTQGQSGIVGGQVNIWA